MPPDEKDKALKLPFELTDATKTAFLGVLSRLITFKIDWEFEKPENATKITKIDLPFIKGYLIARVYLMGKEVFVGYVEIV